MKVFLHGSNAAGGVYQTDAVTFDGVNDTLSENAGNFFNDKRALLSVWVKLNTTPPLNWPRVISDAGITLQRTGAGEDWELTFWSAGSFQEARFVMTHSSTDTGWHHIMANINSNTQDVNCYFDGVAQTNLASGPALDVFLSFGGVEFVAAHVSSASASVADFYWTVSDDIDLSVAANRLKFRSASGKPVFLGDTAELPTGLSGIMFFKGNASVWNTPDNTGSAADIDFVMTGAVTDSATSPSD